jgi:hypothetical protein
VSNWWKNYKQIIHYKSLLFTCYVLRIIMIIYDHWHASSGERWVFHWLQWRTQPTLHIVLVCFFAHCAQFHCINKCHNGYLAVGVMSCWLFRKYIYICVCVWERERERAGRWEQMPDVCEGKAILCWKMHAAFMWSLGSAGNLKISFPQKFLPRVYGERGNRDPSAFYQLYPTDSKL